MVGMKASLRKRVAAAVARLVGPVGARGGSAAKRDLRLLAAVLAVAATVLVVLDPLDRVYPLLLRYEAWELDEILLVMLLSPIGIAWFAWRRMRDLQAEVAARHDAEARARRLALQDSLTELPNRQVMAEFLDAALQDALQDGFCVGVLHLDLDHFKHVNDTLGHDVGDALLRHVARSLDGAVRDEDLAARLGGDEFIVILRRVPEPAAAIATAERIHQRMGEPLRLDDKVVPVSVSAGLAVFPADGETAADLLKHSDLALYEAKRNGRGILEVFDNHLRTQIARERVMESELARALQYQEFTVAFQPEVDARTGFVRGVEAFVRWQHPTRGLLPASEFLPIAARSGQIVEIGAQILEMVLAIVGTWHRQGLRFGTVGINVSVVELSQAHYADRFLSAAASHGIPPPMIRVEVLETLFMSSAGGPARGNLAALAEAGVEVVLDDFGSGFASLSKLSRETVNCIKIDKRFVDRLEHCQETLRLVAMLVDMARFLGFEVVAEGVETDLQRRALVGMGCHVLQGHTISPPLDWQEIRKWLSGDDRRVVEAASRFRRSGVRSFRGGS